MHVIVLGYTVKRKVFMYLSPEGGSVRVLLRSSKPLLPTVFAVSSTDKHLEELQTRCPDAASV